jgi:hypothetical protein
MAIKKQIIKTACYKTEIVAADFYADYLDEDGNTKPIKCQIETKVTIEIGATSIQKKLSNTFLIAPTEEIYKEILLYSKHIILV